MKERKHPRMSKRRAWLLLVSLLLAIGLLLPGGPVGADDPTPTPAPEELGGWGTVTVTTAEVAPKEIERPPEGNLKLGSSLNQLLETHRREGLAEAQAFAATQMMVLDNDRVQVELLTTYEASSSPGEGSGTVDEDRVQAEVEASQEAMSGLIAAIEAVGGEYQGHYRASVQALIPIGALESLAQRSDVQVIREPRRAIPLAPLQIGSQTTEGVAASNASAWHSCGRTGSGVRVAVIDGGFTNYTSRLGSDLPSSVTTYDWTGTGMGGSSHGTACAEIVYDMAYGATMDLHKVSTEVELGNAVNRAIADGVDVISTSLGWILDAPGDGTGTLANIVNNARSNGIFYATAAGNEALVSWSGQYVDHPSASGTHRWPHGSNVNCFGPGTPDFTCYNLPAGSPIVCGLHWDDWTAVNQDYDLLLVRWTGSGWSLVTGSYNRQSGSYPTPEEFIGIYAPSTAPYGVVVTRYSATRNVCLRLVCSTVPHLDEWVSQRSLTFPADSPAAITVGAVDVSSPYPLESYSSRGPTFGPGGSCSGGSTKPDIAAYANVSTVSYGTRVFNGTSAATPHVAGAAALVKGAYPSYSVSQLQSFLEGQAIDLGAAGKDNLYGSGRLYLGAPPCGNNPPNKPSNPSPADGATGVLINADLSWTGGDPDPGDTVTYDVYFEANDSTPDDLLCNDVSTPACDPGALTYNIHYYWYVVATDNHGASTTGDPWDFITESTPGLWNVKTPMSVGRSRPTAAAVNGKVYVIGGEISGGYADTVEEYDPLGDSWRTMSSRKPTPGSNLCSGVINGAIYVPGGYNGTYYANLEIYHPDTDTWETITTDPLPGPRCGAAAAVVNGMLYVFGGKSDATTYLNSCLRYNPSAPVGSRWSTMASMNYARGYLGGAVVNGKVYAIGGQNGSTDNLNYVEEYDPVANTWTVKAPMSTARGGVGALPMGNNLIAVGGGWSSYLTSCEIYTPTTNIWGPFDPLNIGRRTMGVARTNDKLYALAGWNGSYLTTNEEHDGGEPFPPGAIYLPIILKNSP